MRDLTAMGIVGLGVVVVLVGLYFSAMKLKAKRGGEPASTEGLIKAFTELLKVILQYPAGMQLIILGIVIIAIGVWYGSPGQAGAAKTPPATTPAVAASAASR